MEHPAIISKFQHDGLGDRIPMVKAIESRHSRETTTAHRFFRGEGMIKEIYTSPGLGTKTQFEGLDRP